MPKPTAKEVLKYFIEGVVEDITANKRSKGIGKWEDMDPKKKKKKPKEPKDDKFWRDIPKPNPGGYMRRKKAEEDLGTYRGPKAWGK